MAVEGELADAFALVNDDPVAAESVADGALRRTGHDGPASVVATALWLRGMARREQQALTSGAADLQAAHDTAVAAGDRRLAARIAVTQALVVLQTRSASDALAVLQRAAPVLDGGDLARLETQRGLVLHRSGQLDAAERWYERARRRFGGADDPIGLIRVLSNLAILHAQQGRLARAIERCSEAEELAATHGQRFMRAAALHNRGCALARGGHVVSALEDLRAAEGIYVELGRVDLQHVAGADLAEAMLSANLVSDAVDSAERALAGVRERGVDLEVADACLLAARCSGAAGRPARARALAREAAELLRDQGRASLVAVAEYVEAAAQIREDPAACSGDELAALAGRLHHDGWWQEFASAAILSARQCVRERRPDAARAVLRPLTRRRALPAAERAGLAVVRSLTAEALGDRRGARRAVSAGLRTVADNQASFSSLEMRAYAADHGAVLREIGVRLAVDDRRPRELLHRLESTRGRMVAGDAVLGDDPELDGLLVELREVTQQMRGAGGLDDAHTWRRQLEIERAVRDVTRRRGHLRGGLDVSVDAALEELDDRSLLEYAVVGERVVLVSVHERRCRLHDVASVAELAGAVETLTFALHRLNRDGISRASREAAAEMVRVVGDDVRALVLPPPIRQAANPLLIVPDGVLHGVPWRAVVRPDDRVVNVAPSLLGWAAAGRPAHRSSASVTLVAGPGLPGAAAEVERLRAVYPDAEVLTGARATASSVMKGAAGGDVVHFACHGAFRADNPLFSALTLADGELTAHELQRARPAPRTVVLSACSVASSTVLRGGTLLGFAGALMAAGTRSVVAPLTPVNDLAMTGVMVALHRRLAAGAEPATALALASVEVGHEDAADALVAFGR